MGMIKLTDYDVLLLYQQGLTNREIADKLEVTQPAVHYRLEKLGLRNNCHTFQCISRTHVKTLHRKGLTTIGIALVLETNARSVSNLLKRMGLTDNYPTLLQILQQR
ncbi:MAG: Lrp/AsnC family transcriptional regulator [Candidatus Methanofastidiosia archaeon]